MSESVTSTKAVSGQRVVVGIYVGVVAFAGAMGFILGATLEDLESIALLGVIPIPPTPLGLATYGAVTIALVLGVLLLAIRHVAPVERE